MPRIAIVGAGIAGLNAALTLQRAGFGSAVYEASSRIGGRMHSDADSWADGLVSEWCGEFIGSNHTTMRQLIADFGLSTISLDLGISGQAPSLLYIQGRFYGAEELARDFQALAPRLQRQIQEVGFPTTYDHFTKEGRELDHLSAHAWIERYVAGGHSAPLGRFLDAACTGIYGLDSDEQSSLNLIYYFGLHDRSTGPIAIRRLMNSITPRPMQGDSKIAGGNERLPRAIAHSLPDGCIRLGHRLVELERSGDGPLVLTFATAGGSSRVSCDYAILALPFSTLRHVAYHRAGFDPLKRAAIEQLGYGTCSKLFLQFDRPYWYDDGDWPRSHSGFLITDLDIQTLWDASRGENATEGLLVDYTSGDRGAAYNPPMPYATTDESPSIEGYARNCLEQLERVFPGISAHYSGRATLGYPAGDPNLLGSYSCWRVGQYTQFGGYEGVRQGPVLFAGEHCSGEFQGYMEGAAREGARAAREIAAELT